MHFLPPAIEDYTSRYATPDDALLEELIRATHQRTLMPQMLSMANQGAFLAMLVQLMGAQTVVELGTFTGYAAIRMARALPQGGMLHTYEINDELTPFHNDFFGRAGIGQAITVHYGSAMNMLANNHAPGSIDMAFIDADKENYPNYLELLLPLMRVGGLIVADNVLWSGKVVNDSETYPETTALRAYSEAVRTNLALECVLIPLRDGLLLARKKG